MTKVLWKWDGVWFSLQVCQEPWHLSGHMDDVNYKKIFSFVKSIWSKLRSCENFFFSIRMQTKSWNHWRINCLYVSAGACACLWVSCSSQLWWSLNSTGASLSTIIDSYMHKDLHPYVLRIFYSLTKMFSLVISSQVRFISLSGQGQDVFPLNSSEELDTKSEHMFFLPWPA